MPRIRSAVGLAVLCVAVQLGPARAATAGRSFAEEAFQSLLKAIEAHAIDQFTALGDEGFKAMPPGEFDALAAKFAPMLRSGYRASYLGEFKQKDTIVHYWKLTFTSDADDYLAKLGGS